MNLYSATDILYCLVLLSTTPVALKTCLGLVCTEIVQLRIGSCLACVYRVMDARGKFGEHERSVRVARVDSREQL